MRLANRNICSNILHNSIATTLARQAIDSSHRRNENMRLSVVMKQERKTSYQLAPKHDTTISTSEDDDTDHPPLCHERILCETHLDQLHQIVFAAPIGPIQRCFAILCADTSVNEKTRKQRHHRQNENKCKRRVSA